MSEVRLNHPGEVTWDVGHGPAQVSGPCEHDKCSHWDVRSVAWGPDFRHYELVECVDPEGCAGRCRAWRAQHPDGRAYLHPFRSFDPSTERKTTPDEAKNEMQRISQERLSQATV